MLKKFFLFFVMTLVCCNFVTADDISPQTVELLQQAQMQLDASQLVESLKTVVKIRPVENERNQLQWREYDENLDDVEVLDELQKNEFYLKDMFLVKLADRCLELKASPLAVTTARLIGQNTARNRQLFNIVEAQLKATGNPDNASEMLEKAIKTASYTDQEGTQNEVYRRIALRANSLNQYRKAIEIMKDIPNDAKRDALLLEFVQPYRWPRMKSEDNEALLREKEAGFKAIVELAQNPEIKCSALILLATIYFPGDSGEMQSSEKCKETIATLLKISETLEQPTANTLNALIQAAGMYRKLGMSEDAETLFSRIENKIPELANPHERYDVYLLWIGPIDSLNRQEKQPKHDQLIRKAMETTREMESDWTNRCLTWLLDRHPSPELREEILERLSATTLSVREKIDLAYHYFSHFKKPEISKEERVTGFKNELIPMLSDIYTNPGNEGDYAIERSTWMLSEVFFFFYENDQIDVMTELMDLPDIPEALCQKSLGLAAHRCIDGSVIEDVEQIENVFLSRITDPAAKADLRNRLQGRFGSAIGERLNWDEHLAAAKNLTDEDQRFEAYYRILLNAVPKEDASPMLDEMRVMAQGDDETGVHLGRAMKLLNLTTRWVEMSNEEKSQWVTKIETAIEKISDPKEKFRMKRGLLLILFYHRNFLPDETVREEQLTQLLELARAVPESQPGERLDAYWLAAQFAVRIEMSAFADQIVEEGLAFAETLPDKGRRPKQTLSPLEQLEKIKEELTGRVAGTR